MSSSTYFISSNWTLEGVNGVAGGLCTVTGIDGRYVGTGEASGEGLARVGIVSVGRIAGLLLGNTGVEAGGIAVEVGPGNFMLQPANNIIVAIAAKNQAALNTDSLLRSVFITFASFI
jgi:hypothetical protein